MAEDANQNNLPAIGGRRQIEPAGAGGSQLERTWAYGRVRPGMEDEEGGGGGGLSLRDLFTVLFRHKWKIVTVFILTSLATLYALTTMPQEYESEARVFVRGDRTGLTVDPTAENSSILKGGAGIPAEARTEMGIIQSATLSEMVVDKMGVQRVLNLSDDEMQRLLHPSKPDRSKMNFVERVKYDLQQQKGRVMNALHLSRPPMTPRQRAVEMLQGGLYVQPAADQSSILKVSLAASSPTVAKEALDTLMTTYLQRHIEIHGVPVSPEFFRLRSENIKTDLTQKENELDALRKKLNITSLENQKAMLLKQYETFDTALKTSTAQASAIRARIDLIEKARREGRASVPVQIQQAGSDPLYERLRQQLLELRMKEADLSTRFTPQAPMMVTLRAQIASLERMISGEKTGGSAELGPSLSGVGNSDATMQVQMAKAELEAESARQSDFIREIDRLRQELDRLEENGREIQRREREVALLDNEYRQYVNSMQISQVSNALDRDKVANVSIVQMATLPTMPAKSPRKIMAMGLFGILMGLAGGVGLAFALNFFDHSFKTSEEVEQRLGLPVLMAIPDTRQHRPLLREETA